MSHIQRSGNASISPVGSCRAFCARKPKVLLAFVAAAPLLIPVTAKMLSSVNACRILRRRPWYMLSRYSRRACIRSKAAQNAIHVITILPKSESTGDVCRWYGWFALFAMLQSEQSGGMDVDIKRRCMWGTNLKTKQIKSFHRCKHAFNMRN